MSHPDANFTPRLLPAPAAALYLGISESTLRKLNLPRRMLGTKRLFDRYDLDSYASDLPIEGTTQPEDNSCDVLFGASA